MPRQALMVLTASDLPNGELDMRGTTRGGWGTLDPVPWRIRGGTAWRPPQVSNGTVVVPGAAGSKSMLIVDAAVPRAGRVEWQLTPSGDSYADLGVQTAAVGCGLISPDGNDGVVVLVVIGFVAVAKLVAGSFSFLSAAATGLVDMSAARVALAWSADNGSYEVLLDDQSVEPIAFGGDPPLPATGLAAPTRLRPMMYHEFTAGLSGRLPGQGISWLALTAETPEAPAPPRAQTPPGATEGWSLVAARPNGRRLAELRPASWTTTFRHGEPSTVSMQIDGHDSGAAVVDELSTDLHVFVDGRRRLRARVAPTADTLDDQGGHAAKFDAFDLRGLLDRRIIWPHFRQRFVDVPAGQIVRSLIGDTQAMPSGDLGIRFPTDHPDGPLVSKQFAPGQGVRACVDAVIAAVPGAAWDIDDEDLFRWWPTGRGTMRDLIVEHGRNAVVQRTFLSADYANAGRFGGATEAVAQWRWDDHDMARAGRWEVSVGDPSDNVAMSAAARADAAFIQANTPAPGYTAVLNPGVWTPGLLRLGDTCRLLLRSGRLDVDTTAVVQEIAVTMGPDSPDPLSVAVAFNRPFPDPNRARAAEGRRLRNLERR